jgi:aldehyde:ferredoxin oxidoreductase
VGYALADLGSPRVLKASRQGHTGCQWCPVDCRHWHRVPAVYAPGGHDILLDDFEPTYALFAMLGLSARDPSLQARLDLLVEMDRLVMLPIEQLGADAISIGTGLAALLEGVGEGVIPAEEAPDYLSGESGAVTPTLLGRLVSLAAAHGPQALAERYPAMRERVFTSGAGTLGNAGHSNALWTFLMPFSRYFGHYVGQLYKIEAELPPVGAAEAEYRACFRQVVRQALRREWYWVLGNALSMCSFTFVIFSQDGAGERLADDDLLVELLRQYGLSTTRADLEWFGQAFWAQSMALKEAHGWRPPTAEELPGRVYESLALALKREPEELRRLMALLIDEWKIQARERLARFGYEVAW